MNIAERISVGVGSLIALIGWLAIFKRIVEMHGGKIWLECQVGQGLAFAFALPVIVERHVAPTA